MMISVRQHQSSQNRRRAIAGHEWWPAESRELSGSWQLTHEPDGDGADFDALELMFSLNRTPSTMHFRNILVNVDHEIGLNGTDDIEFDVEWVDGKLRIMLDGQMYMRQLSSARRPR